MTTGEDSAWVITGARARKLSACFSMCDQALGMAISRPEDFWAYCILTGQAAPSAAHLVAARNIIELLAIDMAAGAEMTVSHTHASITRASLLAAATGFPADAQPPAPGASPAGGA